MRNQFKAYANIYIYIYNIGSKESQKQSWFVKVQKGFLVWKQKLKMSGIY